MNPTRTTLSRLLCGTALWLALAPAATIQAQPFSQWTFDIALAGQVTDVSGDRDAKFEEYREEPNGFSFDLFDAFYRPLDSPWQLDFHSRDLGQRDEDYALRFDRAARFSGDLTYSGVPHLYSRGATLLHTQTGGRFTLAPGIQAALEANPALLPGILAAQGRSFDVRVQRDVTHLDLSYRIADGWGAHVAARRTERQGNQRISVGTYIRRQAITGVPNTGANFFDRERVEPRSIELPAPVDTTTDDLSFVTYFSRAKVFGSLGWETSSFDNAIDAMVWDNPFEASPGAASSSIGLAPGSEQEPPGSNSGNRGRFVTAALDLWPSNDYQRFQFSGGIDLPADTRILLSYADARMEQNDPFLRYAENEAILFSVGPDGVAGTADDVRAKDVALPRASLNGEVDTNRTDVRITSRPLDKLRLRAAFRRYQYEDNSPTIVFPGYAAAGDSYFRAGIGQRDAAGVRVLFNEVGGYDREGISAGGTWRFSKTATLDLAYGQTTMDYDERQVSRTTENTLTGKFALKLGDRLQGRFTYLDASRDFDGVYAVGFETSRIRAFDVWNRERTRYGGDIDFEANEQLSFGLSFQSGNDEYPGVVSTGVIASNPFTPFPYGLNEAQNDSLAFTAAYVLPRLQANFTLGRESSEWTSLATSKTSLASDAIQFDPANRWVRTQEDDVTWSSVNLVYQIRPERMTLTGDFWYSNYDGDTRTTNPATPNINSGVAYDFPALSSDLLTARVQFDWSLRAGLGFYARYLHEPYRLDDFMWDAVQPSMQGVILETGSSPTQLRPSTVSQVLLLDSRYSDYTANVFAVGIRFHRK